MSSTLVHGCEIDCREAAPLVLPRDRVERVFLFQDVRGVVLGVLDRLIAETLGPRIVPVAARVVGNAPNGEAADRRYGDALHDEMQQIVVAQPRAEMAELGGPFQGAADA